jgi:M26 IgA1-specific metallo-endopeptidase-like protein/GLUG motif-containing protein
MGLSVSNNKNILVSLLTAILLVSTSAFATTNIRTCAELQNINQNLAEQYVLANNIDCSGISFNPIGSTSMPFTGTLDGAGHQVSNLTIDHMNAYNVALFAETQHASIHDIKLINVSVNGYMYVASLIAVAYGTKIDKVSADGTVTGGNFIGGLIGVLKEKSSLTNSSTHINTYQPESIMLFYLNSGGLVGYMEDSSIDQSYTTGPVTGTYDVGGLIGELYSGSVTHCYATGSVEALGSAGGLIGDLYSRNSVNISYSYATSTVKFEPNTTNNASWFGGLIGVISSDSSSPTDTNISISHCYATGNVGGGNMKVSAVYVGGLIGGILQPRQITISDSFATGWASGIDDLGGLIGLVATDHITLSNTYATGAVYGNAVSKVGGLIGVSSPDVKNIISSYWDTQTSGITSPTCGPNTTPDQCGMGKTTAEMYKQSTYIGWDFVNTWDIKEGQGYPWLTREENEVFLR